MAPRWASLGGGFPPPQGEYHTGVGYKNVGCIAREIVDTHLTCASPPGSTMRASMPKWRRASGSSRSSERVPGRLRIRFGSPAIFLVPPFAKEVRCGRQFPLQTSARMSIGTAPACIPTSTKHMREVGGKEYFEKLMAAFDKYKNEHIAVYGPDNHLRLTGLHETQSIDKFNYGVANRVPFSIRVPHSFVNNGYKGCQQDRRPNSPG